MNESNGTNQPETPNAKRRKRWCDWTPCKLGLGLFTVLYTICVAAYLGHVQLVSALLQPEHELWVTISTQQLVQIEPTNEAFRKSLEQLLVTALESKALENQLYLHNRLNFWWNLRREVTPGFIARWFESEPSGEQAAINCKNRRRQHFDIA